MTPLFIQQLSQQLQLPLPGEGAQFRMAPPHRKSWAEYMAQHPQPRLSSVMIVLYERNHTIYFALMQRPSYPGAHSGQVSLPGGKFEEHDQVLLQTALRETEEEIGLQAHQLDVLGALSPLYIPVSNFLVHPYIAWVQTKPSFQLNTREVEELIEVEALSILDNQHQSSHLTYIEDTKKIEVPCFVLNGKVVWGATAMILSEFKEVLAGIPSELIG